MIPKDKEETKKKSKTVRKELLNDDDDFVIESQALVGVAEIVTGKVRLSTFNTLPE